MPSHLFSECSIHIRQCTEINFTLEYWDSEEQVFSGIMKWWKLLQNTQKLERSYLVFRETDKHPKSDNAMKKH